MKVRNNLRVLLAKHDMKQKDFAIKSGFSEKVISDVVNQRLIRYPLTLIEAMVTIFDIKDMNEVFGIIEEQQKEN